MKTIEEKATAYDKALERAKKLQKTCDSQAVVGWCEYLFPELRESEDDRVRKEIMDFIDTNTIDSDERRNRWFSYLEKYKPISFTSLDDIKVKMSLIQYISELNQDVVHLHLGIETCNEWIAWLEKQGEQKPRYSIGDVLCDKSCTTLNKDAQPNFEIVDIRNGMYICDKGSFPISQQDEYELVAKKIEQEPADKVEPKFHEGEWVVDNCSYVWKIEGILNQFYILEGIEGGESRPTIEWVNKTFHLWTIDDAKDGDVLYSLDSKQPFIFKHRKPNEQAKVYCGINIYGKFFVGNTKDCIITTDKYIPAAKEQRNTLFAKMQEAGYEWDAEKKELKKIEDEEYNGEDYGIDSLWHAKRILEKTLGKVDGYQTDDGILEHQCAITAVNKLYKQNPIEWHREDEQNLNACLGYIPDELLRRWLTDAIHDKYDKHA